MSQEDHFFICSNKYGWSVFYWEFKAFGIVAIQKLFTPVDHFLICFKNAPAPFLDLSLSSNLSKSSSRWRSEGGTASSKERPGVSKEISRTSGDVGTGVYHKNTFFKNKISPTRQASIWGLVWRDPKGFLILTMFRGSSSHFRFDHFYIADFQSALTFLDREPNVHYHSMISAMKKNLQSLDICDSHTKL